MLTTATRTGKLIEREKAEVRMDCLRLAASLPGSGDAATVVRHAEAYLAFVLGEAPALIAGKAGPIAVLPAKKPRKR